MRRRYGTGPAYVQPLLRAGCDVQSTAHPETVKLLVDAKSIRTRVFLASGNSNRGGIPPRFTACG